MNGPMFWVKLTCALSGASVAVNLARMTSMRPTLLNSKEQTMGTELRDAEFVLGAEDIGERIYVKEDFHTILRMIPSGFGGI